MIWGNKCTGFYFVLNLFPFSCWINYNMVVSVNLKVTAWHNHSFSLFLTRVPNRWQWSWWIVNKSEVWSINSWDWMMSSHFTTQSWTEQLTDSLMNWAYRENFINSCFWSFNWKIHSWNFRDHLGSSGSSILPLTSLGCPEKYVIDQLYILNKQTVAALSGFQAILVMVY